MKPFRSSMQQPLELGICGIANAGKSTFIARLYARNRDVDARQIDGLTLSFPNPATVPEESLSTMQAVESLWDWVRHNFDKKKKTIEGTRLLFTVQGRGLQHPLHFATHDIPGEVFEPTAAPAEATLADPKPAAATVKALREYFSKNLPNMAGLLVMMDSRDLEQPRNIQLVDDIVRAASEAEGQLKPKFVVVVCTKSGTLPPEAQNVLRERLYSKKGLLRNLRHIHRWVEVVASESLSDLDRVEQADGTVSWELPQALAAGVSGKPSWITGPTEAVMRIPRMLIQYRQMVWRRQLAVATASIILTATFWLGWSYKRDLNDFDFATSQPLTETRESLNLAMERLERYFFRPSFQNRGNIGFSHLKHPVHRHRQQTRRRWNEAWTLKQKILYNENLEELAAEIQKLKTGPLSPIVHLEDLEAHNQSAKRETEKLKGQLEAQVGKWEQDIRKNGLEYLDQLDLSAYSRLPSFQQSKQDIVASRKREFDEAKKQIELLGDKVRVLRDPAAVRDTLGLLRQTPSARFDDLKVRLHEELEKLLVKIKDLGVSSFPHGSYEVIGEVKALVDARPEFQTPAIQSLRSNTESNILAELDRLKAVDAKALDTWQRLETTSWHESLDLFVKTHNDLKDLPKADEWKMREEDARKRNRESAGAWQNLQQKLAAARHNHDAQILDLETFANNRQDHSPEHRREAQASLETVRAEFGADKTLDANLLNELQEKEGSSWEEARKHCEAARVRLKNIVLVKRWEQRRDEYVARIAQSGEQLNKLQQEIKATGGKHWEQKVLLAAYIANEKDHSPEDIQSAKGQLADLETVIGQDTKWNEKFLSELPSKEQASWEDARRHCEDARRQLKDAALQTGWKERQDEFAGKLASSHTAWQNLQQKLDAARHNHDAQIMDLETFANNRQDHSPEYRREAQASLETVRAEFGADKTLDANLLNELQEKEGASWEEARKHCEAARVRLKNIVLLKRWEQRLADYVKRITSSREQFTKLQQEIKATGGKHWEQKVLLAAYIANEKDHSPEDIQSAKGQLADLETVIGQDTKLNEKFLSELPSKEQASWEDARHHCEGARRQLKDAALQTGWKERQDAFALKITNSLAARQTLWKKLAEIPSDRQSQLRLLEDYLAKQADHSPKDLGLVQKRHDEASKEFGGIKKAWEDVLQAHRAFIHDKKTLPALETGLQHYRTTCGTAGCPPEHLSALKEMETGADAERTRVGGIAANVNSCLSQLGNGASTDQRVSSYDACAASLAPWLQTYQREEARSKVQSWLAKLKSDADGKSKYGPEEPGFSEGRRLWEVLAKHATALEMPEEVQTANAGKETARTRCAEEMWNTARTAAAGKTDAGHYDAALKVLNDYRSRQTWHEIRHEDANSEANKIRDAWKKFALAKLIRISSEEVASQPDYGKQHAEIEGLKSQFKSAGETVPLEVEEAAAHELSKLGEKLVDNYKATFNRTLNSSPSGNKQGTVVLTRWDHVDKLSKLAGDMQSDPVVASRSPEVATKAAQINKRLLALGKIAQEVTLTLKGAKFEAADTDAYLFPFSDFPRPKLSLRTMSSNLEREEKLWSVHLDDYENHEEKASSDINTEFKYTTKWDKIAKRFQTDITTETTSKCPIQRGMKVFMRIEADQGTNPLDLTIIGEQETPGILLIELRRSASGNVNIKGKYNTPMTLEIRDLGSIIPDGFTVPDSFDRF